MKQRTYRQVWESLTADQKQILADGADTTYDYLKLIAFKNGRCGRHLATAIASAMVELGYVDNGDIKAIKDALFPHLRARSNAGTHA